MKTLIFKESEKLYFTSDPHLSVGSIPTPDSKI